MTFKEEFLALCKKYPAIDVTIDDYGNKIRIIGAWDDNNIRPISHETMRYQIYKFISSYEGKMNDDITRAEIKKLVEDFITSIQPCSYTVRCDRSNNTPETVDRNELIVNIDITPIHSMMVKFPK